MLFTSKALKLSHRLILFNSDVTNVEVALAQARKNCFLDLLNKTLVQTLKNCFLRSINLRY